MDAIQAWWRTNREAGKTSLLYAYPLGKAQRLLAGLDGAIGPIHAHGSVNRYNEIYRAAGVPLQPSPGWEALPRGKAARGTGGAMILAPPGAHNSAWARQFAPASSAFVSGWMRIRGTRRRQSFDRGFVLSDHADWPELLRGIDETCAETIWVSHGYRAPLVRWIQEHGRQALAVDAHFEGEREEAAG
jgi:putative mRNA 3-end processing factor